MTTLPLGPLIGPVGTAASAGGATLTDTGEGYDFAIGGLGFHLAINDQQPYERATAQFRKEQFDNSDNPGDQSLVGYWTRGQLSFHNGAGIEYYELSAGEEVADRYDTSLGLNPFKPGEVTCNKAWASATPAFTNIAWAGGGKGFWAALDNGVLKHNTAFTAATSYSPTAGTVTSACASPLSAYVGTTSSKIERVGIASGAGASGALYTHSSNFLGIFYAKDRLWAVDSTGTWYQLTPNPTAPPVAVAAADKVFSAGEGWDSNWTLVDTPGPVLIGNGNRLYSVTVGADGVVPTMSGPVTVAELPVGESILGMTYYLGFVTLVTTSGIRVALVTDSGQVVFGPLLVEVASTTTTTLARLGSCVYPTIAGTVYQVDLSKQIGSSLEFGYAQHSSPHGAGQCGTFSKDGLLVAWSDTALKYENTAAYQAGTLRTGFHRFGTLEPKKFQTVKVRVGGAAGSVAVAKVLSGGSAVPMLTINVTDSDGEDITLSMDEPAEMVGLEFTLTPDGADTPILLGYQIRCLPSPRRQRMIRVPLSLHDVERRGTTRSKGHVKSAWERLRALEELEEAGGTVLFQDFRTGESGQCEIQSIEHKGTTPPGRQSDGFGGVLWATLKKL